jgi:hypothetical protein
MTDWGDVVDEAQRLRDYSAGPASTLRKLAAEIHDPVVFCYDPYDHAVFIEKAAKDTSILAAVNAAAAVHPTNFFSGRSCVESRPDNVWLKVAYSPMLRSLGEKLQFFPTSEPQWWNNPSPLAALIASALLGGGLGYLGGSAVDKVFGVATGKKTNLAPVAGAVGALAGSVPAAGWMGLNAADGRPINDPELLNTQPTPNDRLSVFDKSGDDYFGAPLERRPPGPTDVNIDALGRAEWLLKAPPPIQAGILGATYAAGVQPGGITTPGWVTPIQYGRLALEAGGNALIGTMAGGLLGRLTNTPQLRAAGAMAGVAATLVPKLFGA